ncbi:hypothetical protein FALCPG4_018454 [Fusarium falciforme]
MSAACLACKTQHLKCIWGEGEQSRACLRCASTGKVCSAAPVFRFKYSTESPKEDQTWVQCPRRLRFVDETQDVEAQYLSESPWLIGHQEMSLGDSPADLDPSTSQFVTDVDAELVNSSRELRLTPAAVSHHVPGHGVDCSFTTVPQSSLLGLANIEAGDVFPLTKPHEVRLMEYYRDYMCTWFDLCDCRRHFAIVVPSRAATCPTLLNAIFALSSRHLSLTAQYDPYAADRYHQECLKHLTTVSSDSSALTNDDLLAATILLRTLEELDVPLIGTDHEGHLLGIQLFMNTPNTSTYPSSLRQASFWIGLRQEIYMSFVGQRPVKIKLDHLFIDRSFSSADDDTWANRIIIHCAEVINYCFGVGGRNKNEYQDLIDYDQAWLRARPVSWLPIAYSEPNESMGEVFPYIAYLNHAVVIGLVHSIFARILLMCHDDRAPRIGPSARQARKRIDDDIRIQVRELCGTALSNKATRPAMFTACMGITACGDRFTTDKDQRALLDVLILAEAEHSWPTAAAQAHLKKAWGWDAAADS